MISIIRNVNDNWFLWKKKFLNRTVFILIRKNKDNKLIEYFKKDFIISRKRNLTNCTVN